TLIEFGTKDSGGATVQPASIVSWFQSHAAGAATADIGFITTSVGGGSTEKVRITGTGNVGIGTTSPTSALTVVGDIADPGAGGAGSEKFGVGAAAAGSQSLAVGDGASSAAGLSLAIGQAATTAGYGSMAFGKGATIGAHNYSIVFGNAAKSTGPN